MTVIEIKPHRWGWKAFEAPGLVRESGTKSLREIGELFSGFDCAAVAQRIRRTKSTYNSIAARRLITAMLNV
jgi:hypothetical protein